MDPFIYLDFDLCASPFSFDAEDDASEEGAIERTIAKTYNHANDLNGQKEDYQKVSEYFTTKLGPFLNAFRIRIIILTANSARNVRDILGHFGIGLKLRIVSIFDEKGRRAGISPNLFGAVVKKIKNAEKPAHKKKSIESIASKFRVSVEEILAAEENISIDRAKELDKEITKASFIKEHARPFIFLDDSSSEIRSVKALIDDEGMAGQTLHIPRPGRNVPFEECGMFGQPAMTKFIRTPLQLATHSTLWYFFIRNIIKDIRARLANASGSQETKQTAHYVQHVTSSFEF
jgi:hypothetical protein